MNIIQLSSMSKFLFYLLSYAYELGYSLIHVMILIYKLAYSLCVMFLTCSLLFFIVPPIRMNKGRTRDEVTVRRAFKVALNLACQSIGLGS